MTSHNPLPFMLPKEERYNGSNWGTFKPTIETMVRARGLGGYLSGTTSCPPLPISPATQTPTTFWGSATPTTEEWHQCDDWLAGSILLNVENVVGLGLTTSGTASQIWAQLKGLADVVSDLEVLNAEDALKAIRYSEGGDINIHMTALRTAFASLNAKGGNMSDEKFRLIVLRSMPRAWNTFLGTLTKEPTSKDVIDRLLSHVSLMGSPLTSTNSQLTTHILATSTSPAPLRRPGEICTNPSCLRPGHSIERCFKPGGGQEGQYPDWWFKTRPETPVNPIINSPIASTNSTFTSTNQFYAFYATATITAPVLPHTSTINDPDPVVTSKSVNSVAVQSYADTAANQHFFVNREDFTTYRPTPLGGNLATGQAFNILGTGTVKKLASFEGQQLEITFENALHAPDLAHNLVSISCLDQKGFTLIFGGGGVKFLDPGGNTIMRGEVVGGMYQLELRDPIPPLRQAAANTPSLTVHDTSVKCPSTERPTALPNVDRQWADFLPLASHLTNTSPSSSFPDMTPYKVFIGEQHDNLPSVLDVATTSIDGGNITALNPAPVPGTLMTAGEISITAELVNVVQPGTFNPVPAQIRDAHQDLASILALGDNIMIERQSLTTKHQPSNSPLATTSTLSRLLDRGGVISHTPDPVNGTPTSDFSEPQPASSTVDVNQDPTPMIPAIVHAQ